MHRTTGVAFVLALVLLILATPARGQDRPFPPEPTILAPIGLGAALGAAGAVAGGLIGFALDHTCDAGSSWLCIEPGGLAGIAVLGTVGASVGAHLGNRRRGSLGVVLLGSCAAWGAALILALPIRLVGPEAFVVWLLAAVPIVQFGATVAIERITGRRNEARHQARDVVSMFVAPDVRGGMWLGMRVQF
jgi:hypothetical protein